MSCVYDLDAYRVMRKCQADERYDLFLYELHEHGNFRRALEVTGLTSEEVKRYRTVNARWGLTVDEVLNDHLEDSLRRISKSFRRV